MSFFKRILGLETRSSGSWGDLERLLLEANKTAAGISVSPEGALEFTPVLAAVRLISESIGSLPLHIFFKDGEDRQRATDFPLEKLLNRLPNPWTSAYQFKVDLTVQLLLHGEAFALISRNGTGEVIEIVPLPHGAVSVETADDLSPQYFLNMSNGTRRQLDFEEVFHLRVLSHCNNRPLSPVHLGRDAIGLGLVLQRHAANLMSRGARPGGVLENPGKLSEGAVNRLRESIQIAHAGEGSGKTLVLEEGTKYSPLTFSSVDLEFSAMREFQVAEVSRIFRVPLSLLSEMSRVTHANAESLGRQFLSLTLLPYLRLWTETIHRDLLREDEQDQFYAEFNTNALEMADLQGRVDAYTKAITSGLMTSDECRSRENLPPQGGEAAKLRFPLNTTGGGNG